MNSSKNSRAQRPLVSSTAFSAISLLVIVATISGCGSSPPPPAVVAKKPFNLPSPGAETETSLKIGDKFPEFNALDLDGNEVILGPLMYGQRATLIVFWSTWCGPCMQELPHEVELYDKYADVGLRIVGVNADQAAEIAGAAVIDHGVPWPNLYEGQNQTISKPLGITSWPALFLLDKKGKIISSTPYLRSAGIEVLADGSKRQVNCLDWTLEQMLGPPPKKPKPATE